MSPSDLAPVLINILVQAGAVLDAQTLKGHTPAYIAAWKGQKDSLRALITAGADVGKTSKKGASPLLVASQNGHEEAVRMLLQNGADPDTRNCNNASAVFMASQNGKADTLRLLIEVGGCDAGGWLCSALPCEVVFRHRSARSPGVGSSGGGGSGAVVRWPQQ